MDCSICLEHYDLGERIPRVLPCGHSFCTTCLVSTVRGRAELDCPTCRTRVRLREISVNYAVRQVLEEDGAAGVRGGDEGLGHHLWQSLLEALPAAPAGVDAAAAEVTAVAEQALAQALAQRGEEAQRPGAFEMGVAGSCSFLGFYMGAFGYCATLPRGLRALPVAMTGWVMLLLCAPAAVVGGSLIFPIIGGCGALALGPFVLWMPLSWLLKERRDVEKTRVTVAAIGGALWPLWTWYDIRISNKAAIRQLLVAAGQSFLGGAGWGLIIWALAMPDATPPGTRTCRLRQAREQRLE